MRYRNKHDKRANFFEVDLPSVVEGKHLLYEKFVRENDPSFDLTGDGPTMIPFDLNSCNPGPDNVKLIEMLQENGLDTSLPTMFVFEAVLFYVDAPAVTNIMNELSSFSSDPTRPNSADTLLCLTDSLKPFVDVPFTSETTKWFDSGMNLDLLQHRSRWGGAVHFALASSRPFTEIEKDKEKEKEKKSSPAKRGKRVITGALGKHVAERVGALVNSYTPTQANNPKLIENPSFDGAWYAVAYPWQIDGYDSAVEAVWNRGKGPKKFKDGISKPFATRLWNEPMVIYRDSSGELVCVSDMCPHRSAPLSMGTVKDGKLTCFYHGWEFGDKGACTDIPTLHATSSPNPEKDAKFKEQVTKRVSSKGHAVVEHEGMVYVWCGELLEADVSLLPTKRKGDMETIPIDSVLDYSVDYSYIVENNLDSPHLFWLHDGSVGPIESIGMMAKNLPNLRLDAFQDDCGYGHLGRFGDTGRVKKLLRFDPPNIVRHGGVSGFEEEFNIVPIAPYRTRVLLRQHLPKGPILTTITSLPFMLPLITLLVNNWNNVIGLEDAAVMTGQAHNIEDLNAPRMTIGGLGDDLIARYWNWRKQATANHAEANPDSPTPWFRAFETENNAGIATGTSFGDQESLSTRARDSHTGYLVDDEKISAEIGSPGIKQSYLRDTPKAIYPPMNSRSFLSALKFDDIVKSLLYGMEPSSTMLKTAFLADGTELRVRQNAKTAGEEGYKIKTEKTVLAAATFSALAVVDNIFHGLTYELMERILGSGAPDVGEILVAMGKNFNA